VRRRSPADPRLQRLLDGAPERLEAVEACGLPDVLVHGDAHPGNARLGLTVPIWFDWGDSCVGNPLLDLAALPDDHPVVPRWLDRWAAAVPGSDPHRAWGLLAPLAALRLAVVYQGFLDGIEPSERPYHEGDVLPALERAAGLA
jgi:aminoglycoside phosphotransferase (APT) family kinase protein